MYATWMLMALLVLVIFLCVLGFPRWPWAATYGWGPFGGLFLVLVFLVLILTLGGGQGSAGGSVTAHGCALHW